MKENTTYLPSLFYRHLKLIVTTYREHTSQDWQRFLTTTLLFFNAVLLLLATISYGIQFLVTGTHAAAVHTVYFALSKIVATIIFTLSGKKIISFGGLALVAVYLLLAILLGIHHPIQPITVAVLCMAILLMGTLYGAWGSLIITSISTCIIIYFWIHTLQVVAHTKDMHTMRIRFSTVLVPLLLFYSCTIISSIIYVHFVRRRQQKSALPSDGRLEYDREDENQASILRTYDLTVDTQKREVCRSGQPITLRRKEYDILVYLIQHKGTVMTKTQISTNVWHSDARPESLGVHIKHLRDKVDKPFGMPLIETLHSVGYTIKDLPQKDQEPLLSSAKTLK